MSRAHQPHRKSLRLRGYDYHRAGAYFITICVQGRQSLLGEIEGGAIHLNAAGRMVEATWRRIPERFPTTALDDWVIMPNHLHGIIILGGSDPLGALHGGASSWVGAPVWAATRAAPTDHRAKPAPVGAPLVGAQSRVGTLSMRGTTGGASGGKPAASRVPTLGEVIGAFKSVSSAAYIRGVQERGWAPFHRRLWQRNYYEHIIRDAASLQRIREYIRNNPQRWSMDPENPARTAGAPTGDGVPTGNGVPVQDRAPTRGAPTGFRLTGLRAGTGQDGIVPPVAAPTAPVGPAE
jgi:putative transposase